MKKIFFTLAISMAGISQVIGQAKLIEKVEAQPGKLIIPYEKYEFPNGLTLIVSEDHSDPVTHLNVTYHVGSAREAIGKSGFAHFFEHMLFQGSKHVADEEHFKLIRQYGGDVNGNTTRDRTVYIETFPSNFTETALWMEADRMGCFLEAFTNKKFEIQRSTVKNEKDQRYNVPYGFLMEVKDQNLYPPDHPYSWSTIGYVDDLDRVDSNDLRNFFLRWYSPNNACVIISGDVNSQDVVKWVDKYFGSIERGPEVKKQRVKPVQLTENQIKAYNDPNAFVPLVYVTYPSAPTGTADEPALDLLSYLMGSTRKSPLYKKFVETEVALQVNASNNPLSSINHELAGEFSFTVVAGPWTADVKPLQNMLQTVIDSFEFTNFSDEDLERAKMNILSNFSSGLEDVSTKADYLSNYWYLDLKGEGGKMTNVQDEYNTYSKVTREDIMRVYRKYLKGKFSSTVVIQPSDRSAGEKQVYQSFNPNAGRSNPVAEAEYKNLTYKPVKDTFDRSIKPVPGAPKAIVMPSIYRKTLANKLEILGTQTDETPRVLISFNITGGRLLEGTSEIPYGTAELMAAAMNDGTSKKTPEELEQAMEKLGASISIGAGTTSTNVSLSCEVDKLDAALALLEEMMFEPRWDKKEFLKTRKRIKESAKGNLRSRSAGAGNAARALRYGNTPLGTYVGADEYEAVTIENCKAFYSKYFAPDVTKVVVVGAVKADEVYKKLAFLEKWAAKNVVVPKPSNFPKFETSQIFAVEYVDADQSDLIIGMPGLPYDATGEMFKSTIMNFALGGNFNSRLNLNIREDKAWTYGIRSGFSGSYEDIAGYYSVSAGVKANATDSAIVEIVKELNKYKEQGISEEEFKFTKDALLASEALEYESLGQKAGFLMQMAIRRLPENFPQKQQEILKTMTREELNKLAKEQLKTNNMIILVAGDMLLLKERLDKLGYGKTQMLQQNGKGKYKVAKPKKEKHDKNY
jgi:zinc protease